MNSEKDLFFNSLKAIEHAFLVFTAAWAFIGLVTAIAAKIRRK